MKESELIGKVHSAVYHQCKQRGYAAPADVLVDSAKAEIRRLKKYMRHTMWI